jgi:hypothetical protein
MTSTANLPFARLREIHEVLDAFRGMPMTPEASKALAAAVYHLDGLEIACKALCKGLGA